MSLLVALVSLSIAAVPILRQAFTPQESVLTGAFQVATFDTFSVLVSNAGGRPGSIRGGTLRFFINGRQPADYFQIDLVLLTPDSSGAIVIAPGQTALVKLQPDDKGALHVLPGRHFVRSTLNEFRKFFPAKQTSSAACVMTYAFSNFDSESEQKRQTLPCSYLGDFLHAIRVRGSQLSGAFQIATADFVSSLITNTGSEPGTVHHALVQCPIQGPDGQTHKAIQTLSVVAPYASDAIVVPSQQTLLVRFQKQVGWQWPDDISVDSSPDYWSRRLFMNRSEDDCTLIYVFSDFDGEPEHEAEDVPGKYLTRFFQ